MKKSQAESRLEKMGLQLPPAPQAVGAYVTVIRTGNLVVTAGQLPWKEGKLAYTGKLGVELTTAQGYEAAKIAGLNALAQIKSAVGDLDKVRQIVRLEGYVHCGPGFREHPQVLNGASELLNGVFGDKGKHTRTAVGIHEMPLDSPVQIIVWAEVADH
jgi:enamine deaminase RidA (YjgF/YER057c/UK114 family)